MELGKSKIKAYFLVNCLPEASEILDWYFDIPHHYMYNLIPFCRKAHFPKMGLLFFILAHIMMNQNHLPESMIHGIQ